MGHREPQPLTAARLRAALDLPPDGGDEPSKVALKVAAGLVARIRPDVLVEHVLPVLDGFVSLSPADKPRWRLVVERVDDSE